MAVPVAGVDGCRGGWAGVTLGDDGACVDVRVARSFEALVDAFGSVTVVGVDMPVGLLDTGVRECERAARALLGARAATVFSMPPRDALAAPTHAEAVARCRALGVPGISAQGYALARKVFEVERVAASGRVPLVEIHPELSFRAMTGAVLPRKRTPEGVARREDALRAHGIDRLPRLPGTARDDVLDAAAVAWSALRYARGEALALPDPPQLGPRGDQIAIWF